MKEEGVGFPADGNALPAIRLGRTRGTPPPHLPPPHLPPRSLRPIRLSGRFPLFFSCLRSARPRVFQRDCPSSRPLPSACADPSSIPVPRQVFEGDSERIFIAVTCFTGAARMFWQDSGCRDGKAAPLKLNRQKRSTFSGIWGCLMKATRLSTLGIVAGIVFAQAGLASAAYEVTIASESSRVTPVLSPPQETWKDSDVSLYFEYPVLDRREFPGEKAALSPDADSGRKRVFHFCRSSAGRDPGLLVRIPSYLSLRRPLCKRVQKGFQTAFSF